ncbi:MAG: 30S ribosome-binding factor RbfA, partial [Planctomycetota bacterium]
LYQMKDPRVGFVTVTRVELSEDQRSAKVLLTVRGTPEEAQKTLRALKGARGYMQALIGKRLTLRYTPVLNFKEDKEVLGAMRIEKLIDEARKDDQEYHETP